MTRTPIFQFTRHYSEMVLVMFAGMFVLGGALLLAAAGAGVGRVEFQTEAPALFLLGMGLSMTAPMVWWMRRRGHSRAANGAMASAMILPTLATIVLLASGAVTDLDTLLGIEHMAMFPAMIVAMLPFRGEYTHTHAEAVA
jgi:flagellar biosynthetic protein FliP